MIKIIIMIECDSCNHPFLQIRSQSQVRERLHDDLHKLQIQAEGDGWMLCQDATAHICPTCNYGSWRNTASDQSLAHIPAAADF